MTDGRSAEHGIQRFAEQPNCSSNRGDFGQEPTGREKRGESDNTEAPSDALLKAEEPLKEVDIGPPRLPPPIQSPTRGVHPAEGDATLNHLLTIMFEVKVRNFVQLQKE